tara:strand:+ start:147058 stop:147510 length:453 start_codon:yes stop_codon:yes gene_type:complete
MKKISLITALFFLMVSCNQEPKSVTELTWLTGQWTRDFNGNTQLEKWTMVNDSLVGSSSFITSADTTIMTNYKIYVTSEGFTLKVQEVGFENETNYASIAHSQDSILFYNATANWPQSVTYKAVSDKIQLTIDGNDRGMHKNVKFTYMKN